MSAYVQIPLNGPDQTLSLVGSVGSARVSDKSGPDVVAGRVWSCRVLIPLHRPDRTRPDMSAPATSSPTKSAPCQAPLHGLTDFVCDPTRPDPRTKAVQKVLRGCVRRPKRSVCLVWSGRVRVVEFKNDTTRPDQRQSAGRARLVEYGQTKSRPNGLCRSPCLRKSLVGPVWWTLDNI